MHPIFRMAADVAADQTAQMRFVQHNDTVKKLSLATPNLSSRGAILPRGLNAFPFGLKAGWP